MKMHVQSERSDDCVVSVAVHRGQRQRGGDAAAYGNTETCRRTSQETAHHVRMVNTAGHHHRQSQHAAVDTMVSGIVPFLFSHSLELGQLPLG